MPTASQSATTSSARALTYSAYISFIPIGIATVLLGPMLPSLSERWSLNYAQAGALFNAQYVASTVAVGVSGLLAARWGFRFVMKIGLVLMAAGLALLLSGSKLVGIFSIAAYGGGLGLAVPPANLLVAAVNPTHRSARLNLLNFFWSMGAVACPFFVAAAAKTQHIPLFLACVAGFSIAVAIGIALMPARIVEPAATRDTEPTITLVRTKPGIFLILAILFLLYVGVENSFGQWMASYSKSLGSLTLAMALATPAFFYASLMVGRWMAPVLLRLIDEVKLVQVGLLLACAGMTGLMLSHQLAGVATSACAAGLGLASVYPITIALLPREFGSASTKLGSIMFVLSNIGGGLLPSMVGVASDRAGTIRAGLFVPLIGCMVMFALYFRQWSPVGGSTTAIGSDLGGQSLPPAEPGAPDDKAGRAAPAGALPPTLPDRE